MDMGTVTLISEEQYLHTSYEPDCEFEDGTLIERNVGEKDHSWLQGALCAFFFRRRKLWSIEVFPEQRVRIRLGRYRIPDVCVYQSPSPAEQVFTQPPLIWIEILSPEDRPIRVNRKIRELLDFGVQNVWIIEPTTLESEIYTPAGSRTVEDRILRVEGTPIEVPLNLLEED
jgi:Uma2 family endonuclease